jgi:hypothetical protein
MIKNANKKKFVDLIIPCLQLAGQSVLVGRVDCDSHPSLGTRFHITKYPTLKYVQNGQLGKKEYRGQRSAQAFLEFVQEQIKNPVQEIRHVVIYVSESFLPTFCLL